MSEHKLQNTALDQVVHIFRRFRHSNSSKMDLFKF